MCIEMLPNYNHTVIVNFSTVSQYTNEDDNIFITINNRPIKAPNQKLRDKEIINAAEIIASNKKLFLFC